MMAYHKRAKRTIRKLVYKKVTNNLAKFKYTWFLMILLVIVINFKILQRYTRKPDELRILQIVVSNVQNEVSGKTKKIQPKLILIYTKFWGETIWPGFESSERFISWGGHPCKIQNCRVTYNKKMLGEADVVIFHAVGDDMVTLRKLKRINFERNPKSYWVYFVDESPQNLRVIPAMYNRYFNWTMNYRRDSDIHVPFAWERGTWGKRNDSNNNSSMLLRNHTLGKTKLVWVGINRCGCMRDLYINKLMEYLPIDLYGRCMEDMYMDLPPKCPRGVPSCNRRLKHYKFYLAFENSFCEDYATEKFSETIFDGHTVPIVMGGADYKILGLPDSFIDVNDFDTVKKLADYIKYLDGNDTAYSEYFQYQQIYKLGNPLSWSCKICDLINSADLESKIYHKLGNWFSVQNNCGKRLDRLREILHDSNVTHPYTDIYHGYDYDYHD